MARTSSPSIREPGKWSAASRSTLRARFVIGGLEPGPYVLRVEPLDDGDVESFFDLTLNIDANFRPKFHDRLVVVPRGGGAGDVEIRVEPKS